MNKEECLKKARQLKATKYKDDPDMYVLNIYYNLLDGTEKL